MLINKSHPFVRELKANQTPAELKFNKLLKKLLKEHFSEYKILVNAQVPITHSKGFYILDFHLGTIKTAFEVDGGYHWESDQLDRDLKRDEVLKKEKGIVVYHISNNRIMAKHSRAKQRLKNYLVSVITYRIGARRRWGIQKSATAHGWKRDFQKIGLGYGSNIPLPPIEAEPILTPKRVRSLSRPETPPPRGGLD